MSFFSLFGNENDYFFQVIVPLVSFDVVEFQVNFLQGKDIVEDFTLEELVLKEVYIGVH
jgi:hypothetical protein